MLVTNISEFDAGEYIESDEDSISGNFLKRFKKRSCIFEYYLLLL